MSKRYMKISEVAEILNCSVDTARRRGLTSDLPMVNIGGGNNPTWRVPADEFDAWLAQRRHPTTK